MNNPFEVIEARLSSIENLILDFKHNPQTVEPTEQPEQLLTIQEAAEFLKLAVSTIYSKVSRNELPVMKRGKRLYFSKSDLMDYLKAGRRKTNEDLEKEVDKHLEKKIRL